VLPTRRLPVIAPSMRSSDTGKAKLGQQSEFTPLVDDAALRWLDGDPRPTPLEEDRCHSTEV
jgi:hypothetical protein